MKAHRARRLLLEAPNSISARSRASRWQIFRSTFPDIGEMRVLDLGGTPETWRLSPVKPFHVTVLNLYDYGDPGGPDLDHIQGDACRAGEVLKEWGRQSDFDLVFSNSLIEHVGGHARRVDLAKQVRELAPRHWVQTPYRYFPLEPHWLFPAMQFMPAMARVSIAMHWPLSWTVNKADLAREQVLWTELLSITEMRDLFPDSVIVREKALGLTKSLIAVADDAEGD
jgi:hypothetical protein